MEYRGVSSEMQDYYCSLHCLNEKKMEKIDIVMWIMGAGFTVTFALMKSMWNDVNRRMDTRFKEVNDRMDARFKEVDARFKEVDARFKEMDARFKEMDTKIDIRFDKLDEKVTDIDRRLCRLEGAFSSKECCILKYDKELRKAE
jgi:predicted nuclease with TOPRIM domain